MGCAQVWDQRQQPGKPLPKGRELAGSGGDRDGGAGPSPPTQPLRLHPGRPDTEQVSGCSSGNAQRFPPHSLQLLLSRATASSCPSQAAFVTTSACAWVPSLVTEDLPVCWTLFQALEIEQGEKQISSRELIFWRRKWGHKEAEGKGHVSDAGYIPNLFLQPQLSPLQILSRCRSTGPHRSDRHLLPASVSEGSPAPSRKFGKLKVCCSTRERDSCTRICNIRSSFSPGHTSGCPQMETLLGSPAEAGSLPSLRLLRPALGNTKEGRTEGALYKCRS